MKIVFWLDPGVGFDRNTPEILSNFADELALLGYEVELLVQDQNLDDYMVENAAKRIWFEEGSHEILADVLISNRLENLFRNDLHQAGEKIWLALEEKLTTAINYFESYQLYDEIRVFTFFQRVKNTLAEAGIDGLLIQPGVQLEHLKVKPVIEREERRITIALFNDNPDVVRAVLQGVEMTRKALEPLYVRLIVDRKLELKVNFPVQVKIKPILEERIQYYKDSDLFIHISGDERFSLLPLEVMAVGLPLILYAHPSIKSYARDRENCLIVKELSPQEIALAILKIMKIGMVREQLKSNGPKTSPRYDIAQSLQALQRLWDTMPRLKEEKMNDFELDDENPRIDLVVVNYNSDSQIRECLRTLREHTKVSYRIIVVDNNSEDESLEYLKKEDGISLILNHQNTGFAKACNQGILVGKGKYIALLHSDVQVTEGWLNPLLAEIRKSDIGMVGSRIINAEGQLKEDHFKKDSSQVSSYLTGGCLIIKRELLNKIGLFDEEFFLYHENIDYSYRIQEKGYKLSYCPGSTLLHTEDHCEEDEDGACTQNRRELRKHFYSQSENYFEEKWGEFTLDRVPERRVDGIVVFSLHPWQKRVQRTEAMVDYFTRQGLKVVYVEPYCASLAAQDLGYGQYLYICKGNGTIYHNVSNVGRRIELTQELKIQLKEWEIVNPIFWVESPWWEPIIKHIEHRLLIYISPEILLREELVNYQQLKEKFSREEKLLLEAADLIIVASQLRLKEWESYQNKMVYSPGGFYPKDLERFLNGHFTMPDELIPLSGYKVGIVGTLDRYFSKHLLRELALKHPEVSFAFIGEITCNLEELREIKNLYFLGNKEWNNLLDCIYFFDLMLYPYPDKGLNSYLDPYMINYYLAMGKPVVAFKHQELEKFGQVIKKAEDEGEYRELTSQMISQLADEKGEERIRERIHQVVGFSWEDRFDDLYQEISVRIPVMEEPVQFLSEEPAEEKEDLFTSILKPILNYWRRLRNLKNEIKD